MGTLRIRKQEIHMTTAHIMYIGLALIAAYFALRLFYRMQPQIQRLRTAILDGIEQFESLEKKALPQTLSIMDKSAKEAQDKASAAAKAMKEHMRSPLWLLKYRSFSARLRRLEESMRELKGLKERELDRLKILVESPLEKRH